MPIAVKVFVEGGCVIQCAGRLLHQYIVAYNAGIWYVCRGGGHVHMSWHVESFLLCKVRVDELIHMLWTIWPQHTLQGLSSLYTATGCHGSVCHGQHASIDRWMTGLSLTVTPEQRVESQIVHFVSTVRWPLRVRAG